MFLSKKNFTFGVANNDNNCFIDETVYTFIFSIYHLNNSNQKIHGFILKNDIIQTDDGFLLGSLKFLKTFTHSDIITDMKLKDDNENWLFTFTVYSGDMQNKFLRKYEKMETLLARLGGICNFLFLFGFMISKFENQYNLISRLSNELFIFQKFDKKNGEDNI